MEEAVEMDRSSGVRKYVILAIAAIVLVPASLWGVRRVRYATTHESTNDAFVAGHRVPVSARVAGFVADVRVIENQHVAAGDTLLTLATEELDQRVDQAAAELAVTVA